ncbi:MFS transporter [Paenibacillus spiritus]|uniref:MFS transporter n=1 Tax=Paenibacillus spiritus TaxID=2496557 RepID=A0A5J5G947_9BACL|nr:MFS transporter [Paenibacillus spiritus]KAA9004199.1 MFS transporter [Paenibacillus spiritus]
MSRAAALTNSKMIIFMLFLGNLFSSFDRFVINYGIVQISDEFQLNASASGFILSIFFLGYAIMQVPGGWLSDRFGEKIVLFSSIVGFSLFTALTGLAWSVTALLIIRLLFGVAEGSFFPAGSKLISTSIEENKRSRAMSIFLSALTVAGVAAPILTTVFLVQLGWRTMFIIIGGCGLCIAVLYWIVLKPNIKNQSTRSKTGVATPEQLTKGSFKRLLKTPLIWRLVIASFGYGFISWGTSSWIPTYLVKERGISLSSLGLLQMIPALTGVIFFLIAGVIMDKMKSGTEKWLGAFSGIALAVTVYLMFHAETITGVIVFQCLIPVFSAFLSVIIYSLPIKRLPEETSGSAVGLVNIGAQVAGFAAPLGIGLIIDSFNGSYDGVVWLLCAFGLLIFLSFLTLQSGRKPLAILNIPEGG